MNDTLKDRLVRRIERQGPIPFEEFHAAALYDTDFGFFTAGPLRSTRNGDFLTSPEVSPLFGETVAEYVRRERARLGHPTEFVVVDAGAGSGSLLRPLLEVERIDAWAVEVSSSALETLRHFLPPGRAVATVNDLPGHLVGVVVANELVDNLPVAVAVRTAEGWEERWVGVENGELALVDSTARELVSHWCDRFAGPVGKGGFVEVQLAASEWVRSVLNRLQAGSLLLIDYGDTAEALAPRRAHGTLRTYRSHHLGPDPLLEPGATDITVDVNFTALKAVAEDAGTSADLVRQEEFLTGLGLRDRLRDLRHQELGLARTGDEMERLKVRSLRTEAEALLHPRGLGDFQVLLAAR